MSPSTINQSTFEALLEQLKSKPKVWLVTGNAGFIGSNLSEFLLKHNQKVVGLDNFSTGYQHNIDDILASVGEEAAKNFTFIEGDIADFETCAKVCEGVDIVLHQAALGSVPRSIADPVTSNRSNITGFLNMLTAAKDAGIRRFVYASSSSVHGDSKELPKVEERTGNLLSPYAAMKMTNELYAGVSQKTYGMETLGLRYFNVFGRRQDPDGAYAAVIPKWVGSLKPSTKVPSTNNQPTGVSAPATFVIPMPTSLKHKTLQGMLRHMIFIREWKRLSSGISRILGRKSNNVRYFYQNSVC